MILFLLLLLFLACIIPPGLSAKDPPRDCIPKSGPHEKPQKPPEKRKNKNNITSRKAAKIDLLRAVFGMRCFQDPRTIAAGTPCPIRFSTAKCGSDTNRGCQGEEERKKQIKINLARVRVCVKFCVYAYVHERKFMLI